MDGERTCHVNTELCIASHGKKTTSWKQNLLMDSFITKLQQVFDDDDDDYNGGYISSQ